MRSVCKKGSLAVYRLHPDAADDPADLLSTLGHYYRRKGMREKEVEVIQEAMDWCVAHPEKLNRGFRLHLRRPLLHL